MRFISFDEMEEKGYGEYRALSDKKPMTLTKERQ
jgi:hypothetical protein